MLSDVRWSEWFGMSFDECDNISNLFVFHSILVRFVEHGNEWIQQTDAGRINRVASVGPIRMVTCFW
jgi:hypothetical protein